MSEPRDPERAAMDPLSQEIIALVANILETTPETIDPQRTWDQVQRLDSVVLLEILVMIERRYHVDLPETEIKQLRTLSDLIAWVRARRA